MKLTKLLTTTAVTLSMITASGVIAYAASSATEADAAAATAPAAAEAEQTKTKQHSKARHHDKRGAYFNKRGSHGSHFGMAGGGEMMRALLAGVDTDGDGQITQEEIDTYRAAKVSEFDASGDGSLSIEEFDQLYRDLTRSRMVRAFQALDADGDGVITAEEMDSRFGNIVERMSRDGSDSLSIKVPGQHR